MNFEYDEKGCRLTVMAAYEIAAREVDSPQQAGHPPGFYVNHRNELKPIRAPHEKADTQGRKLVPVSIDSLIDADGDVNAAEANDVEELLLVKSEPVLVAGEETEEEYAGSEEEVWSEAADEEESTFGED